MERIDHCIGGKLVPGESGRRGPVFDPATGRADPRGRLRHRGGGRRRRRRGRRGVPRVAGRVPLEALRDHVPHARPRRGAPHRHREDPHGAARQGHVRCHRRGPAGPREHRVRLRHPDPAEGRLQRAGLHRRRRVLDPAAARRRRRHHPVQLPRDGSHLDVRERDRVREHLRAEALRKGSRRVDVPRRAAQGGRTPRRRVQRRARRQGRGGPDPRAPGDPGRSLRGLDADRAIHLRDRHAQREARAGPRRRQEPHGRAPRRRRGDGGRRRRQRGLRFGGRAVHGHLGHRGGRRRRRPAGRGDPGAPAEGEGRARATTPSPRWGRS